MNEKVGSVLVIGGGIAGMQASIDLADQGFKVYLVEKSPSIGGRMSQLDKTFPTNDCAMCTQGPKMVEVGGNPNIKLLTYSEVISLEGEVGYFKVKILKKPRYIDEIKCNGCGMCSQICPVTFLSEFDSDIGAKKSAYIPFPQATPLVYALEYERCMKCGLCKVICEADAIDYNQKPEEIEIEVGSIIIATGFEVLKPTIIDEYCYGKYKNVLTALEYERLLAASGPTSGHVIRPSDGKEPKKIAWIQCVGSRDIDRGNPYCSRVCCTYATKEAMITKEHDPDVETTIFYIDRRTYGKGFEEYYVKARDSGVNYLRGVPGEITKDKDENIKIKYEDTTTGKVKEMMVDLLVLSSSMIPSKTNKELSEVLGVELDENGFFLEKDPFLGPSQTTKKGIYLAGCAQGPKDIPDSVAQACSAASNAVIPIFDRKGTETEEIEVISEKEVKLEDEPKIGVFICHCGINIAGVIDVDEVTSYAKSLPNVSYADHLVFACSEDSQSKVKEAIEEYGLNRVVVASCTPTTHEPLFQRTCADAGLNPYLFEMATIREHCSWVHSKEPEKATKKAMELVKMAVSKSRMLEPLKKSMLDVNHSALVIGGGISGMTTALNIAKCGFLVHLVEKEKELGGMLLNLNKLMPLDIEASEVVNSKLNEINENSLIQVHTETEIDNVDGYVGNYNVSLKKGSQTETINVGAVVIATGFSEIDPEGYYEYEKHENVITQLQLEKMLKDKSLSESVKNVVMINCVGSREESGRSYCCRIGCGTATKNARYIKELIPDSNVTVLFEDMIVFGKREEEYYFDTKKNGIEFLRYPKEDKPKVQEKDGKLIVSVYDQLLGEKTDLEADLVVLTVATEGSYGCQDLQKMFKIPLGVGNFFTEVHAKIRPLDFVTDGIFLCGAAHFPKGISDAISQAEGAASRACTLLSKENLESEAIISHVNERWCAGCEACIPACPYDARELDSELKVIKVNEVLCQGCGACVVVCPNKATKLAKYKENQIFSMIDAALGGDVY